MNTRQYNETFNWYNNNFNFSTDSYFQEHSHILNNDSDFQRWQSGEQQGDSDTETHDDIPRPSTPITDRIESDSGPTGTPDKPGHSPQKPTSTGTIPVKPPFDTVAGNVAQYILADDVSYTETKICRICTKQTTKSSVIVPINVYIIKQFGFRNLADAIESDRPTSITVCCKQLKEVTIYYSCWSCSALRRTWCKVRSFCGILLSGHKMVGIR